MVAGVRQRRGACRHRRVAAGRERACADHLPGTPLDGDWLCRSRWTSWPAPGRWRSCSPGWPGIGDAHADRLGDLRWRSHRPWGSWPRPACPPPSTWACCGPAPGSSWPKRHLTEAYPRSLRAAADRRPARPRGTRPPRRACQWASGGGQKPVTPSWKSRMSRATQRRRSSGPSRVKVPGQAIAPGMKVRTSRLCSSRPRGCGAPWNPAACRWSSRACTAGVHWPAGRRTVSPIRTTPPLTFPLPAGSRSWWVASSGGRGAGPADRSRAGPGADAWGFVPSEYPGPVRRAIRDRRRAWAPAPGQGAGRSVRRPRGASTY
jgi:hypothetical protein